MKQTRGAPLSRGRVDGKKVFITGGAQGLGAVTARRLAEEGATIAVGDIKLAGAEAVARQLDAEHGAGTAFAFALDVTEEAQWIAALAEADTKLNGLSVLVNNAGVFRVGDIEALSFDDWKSMMAVNVDSVFLGVKHALKYLRKNQPGSIVNISSIAGLIVRDRYQARAAGAARPHR